MIKVITNCYLFDELSDKAKEKVISYFRENIYSFEDDLEIEVRDIKEIYGFKSFDERYDISFSQGDHFSFFTDNFFTDEILELIKPKLSVKECRFLMRLIKSGLLCACADIPDEIFGGGRLPKAFVYLYKETAEEETLEWYLLEQVTSEFLDKLDSIVKEIYDNICDTLMAAASHLLFDDSNVIESIKAYGAYYTEDGNLTELREESEIFEYDPYKEDSQYKNLLV